MKRLRGDRRLSAVHGSHNACFIRIQSAPTSNGNQTWKAGVVRHWFGAVPFAGDLWLCEIVNHIR
jgi:hypothetical protein